MSVKSKKVIFICSANKDRSATAADYFRENYPDHQFDSAGTNQKTCFQLGTEFLTSEHLEWADTIYVMEGKHKKFTDKLLKSKKQIQVLGIADHYTYFQQELIDILKDKVIL